jgi:hypothetical protein
VITRALSCPLSEVACLGRTLRAWRTELLTYFDTGGASTGLTETINLLTETTHHCERSRDFPGFAQAITRFPVRDDGRRGGG